MNWKPYPAYKDSGVEWLGEVPEGWEMLPLKRLAKTQLSNVDKHSVDGEQSVKLCNYVDVYKNERITADMEFMSATASDEQIRRLSIRHGDVLITKDSETPDDIGVPALVAEDLGGVVCGYHLALLRPHDEIGVGGYLARLLTSTYVRAQFATSAVGMTRYGLGKYEIENVLLPAPSTAEQTSIATFLDRETAKLDTLIAKQEKLIELIDEKIIALADSCSRQTSASEIRLAHVADLIARPVAICSDETYEPLGIFNRGRGLFHKDPRGGDEMGDSDFFWVKDGDLIISGQFAWEGAIALATEREYGCVVSHRYPVLRGKGGIAKTEFLFATFLTKYGDFILDENSVGSAGRNRPLNIRTLLKEKIWLPEMKTQDQVVELVHERRQIESKIKKQIECVKEHRAALITAAVTGKIDVRESA